VLRQRKVILDRDLAALYGISTKIYIVRVFVKMRSLSVSSKPELQVAQCDLKKIR